MIFVGTSGWAYRGWRDSLYRGVPMKRWLAHAARTFGALEINGSFYVQIKPETYRRWRAETPEGFRFALKGHRFVTHYKRLQGVEDSIRRVRDPARELGDRLAVVVWQLPSNFACDVGRLAGFLEALACWDDVRHSIELRHRSWFTDEVAALLAAHRVASCMGDAPDFPLWPRVTTDLVHVRLHGHTRKYASSYSAAALQRWARDALAWASQGREVHLYLDNDAEGAAISNALALRRMIDERRDPAVPGWREAGNPPP